MNEKYINVSQDAIKSSELDLDFNSEDFNRLFYDSIIIKATHFHSHIDHVDNLYFEILLGYFDKVIALDFIEVIEIESASTLGYFPEIREINITYCKNRSLMQCEFIPMWGDKSIKFYYGSLKMISHLISNKKIKLSLGNV